MKANLVWVLVMLGLGASNLGCSGDSVARSTPDVPGGAMDAGGEGQLENPYLRAAGIGVSDLEKASAFLTGVLGMTEEGREVTRDDRVERTFWAKEVNRGSRVVLMKFDDGRNTQDITAKLVFQAPDVQATYQGAVDAGFASIIPPVSLGTILVSQVKGPDGYTVEILNGIDAGGADATKPYFIALAFGVTDFTAARKFYADAFGMKETVPYNTDDLVEQSMEYPAGGGGGLVLQHYNMTAHNYRDNPVKHVSYVPDLDGFVAQVTGAGGTVVQKAAPMPAYGGKRGAVLKDPDGVLIELVQG